jgi:hypothetical protein
MVLRRSGIANEDVATATAERRTVLAGYRLAEQVNKALQPAE